MKAFFQICNTVFLILILVSCMPATPFATATPVPTSTHIAEPTPTFEGIADCRWSGTGFVWIDQNGDGIYQDGEQPVPDVSVFVDDTLNGKTDVGDNTKTTLTGEANLSVWLPGCPDVEFEVYIQVPDGYTLTSAPKVKDDGMDDRMSFGLTYLPGVSTATPLPPSPTCNIYPFPRNRKFVDFSIDDDETIWVATESNGVYRQLAGQAEWVHWEASDYLVSGNIWAVKAQHGFVWIATPYGVSTLVGDTWQSYTEADGLISDVVFDVAIEKDGSAWFATNKGISYFSFVDKSWRSFSQIPDVKNFHSTDIDIASDNTVWLIPDAFTIVRLVWPDHRVEPEWEVYSRSYQNRDAPIEYSSPWNFSVDTFGNIWFTSFGGFTRFNVFESKWFPKYFDTDIYYLEKEFWLVAPDLDGSVWMTEQSDLYHYFPADTKADKDVMFVYHTGTTIPDINSIISIEVAPDGKVWLIMEHQIYECEFFD